MLVDFKLVYIMVVDFRLLGAVKMSQYPSFMCVFCVLCTHVVILANSADPNEMPLLVALFHLGLHCLPKYVYRFPQ